MVPVVPAARPRRNGPMQRFFLCPVLAHIACAAAEEWMQLLLKSNEGPVVHSWRRCFDSSGAENADIERYCRCDASTKRACNLDGSDHASRPTVAPCAGEYHVKSRCLRSLVEGRDKREI